MRVCATGNVCDRELATNETEEPPNTLMVQTNPGAAQGVLRPLCLLSGFAAHQHVGCM